MRLLIKQRVFSWSDTYDIYDEEGNVRYFVRAEVFALGHQIHVYDAAHVEVGMIRLIFFRSLKLKQVGSKEDRSKNSLPCSSRNMILILMDGVWREISLAGIMMYIPAAVPLFIFQNNYSTGVILMRSISPIPEMNCLE